MGSRGRLIFDLNEPPAEEGDGVFCFQLQRAVPSSTTHTSDLFAKQRETKGAEASHVLKFANNLGKRPKLNQHKEAMLGKKRNRQTMFFNLEDIKQTGPIKTSTPRRQNFSTPTATRSVRETHPVLAQAERNGEEQNQSTIKDAEHVDSSCNEGNGYVESDRKSECNGDMNSGLLAHPRRLNSATDLTAEAQLLSIHKQSSWKQHTDSRQSKNVQVSSRKPALIGQNSMELGTPIKHIFRGSCKKNEPT